MWVNINKHLLYELSTTTNKALKFRKSKNMKTTFK